MVDICKSAADIQKLLDIDIGDDKLEKLNIYHGLLQKWQKGINLVSATTLNNAWNRHFLDSAQLLRFIDSDVKVIADLGSGAGFPGLVLAVLNPNLEVHLIESDERKCLFLRTVSRGTGVNVSIHNQRIENVADSISPDLVTARAFANLNTIFDNSILWANRNKNLQLLLLKGEKAPDEIRVAQDSYSFNYKFLPSITSGQANIISVNSLSCV